MVMFRCQFCGTPLKINEASKIAFCPHCGQSIRLDSRNVKIKSIIPKIKT